MSELDRAAVAFGRRWVGIGGEIINLCLHLGHNFVELSALKHPLELLDFLDLSARDPSLCPLLNRNHCPNDDGLNLGSLIL